MDNYKKDDSIGEEASAFGQRAKGATKEAAGAMTGNDALEREGERENAMGARDEVIGDGFTRNSGINIHHQFVTLA